MKDLYSERRKKVLDELPDRSLVILYSGAAPQRSGDQNYSYTVNRNYYYLTGHDAENYVYAALKLNGKVAERYFIPRPELRNEIFNGKMPTDEEITEEYGCAAEYIDRFEDFIGTVFNRNIVENLYMDLEQRSVSKSTGWSHNLASRLMRAYPYLALKDIGFAIGNMRRIKSSDEINLIKEGIRITGLGIESILDHMAPGVNENTLQAWFEFTIKTNGASDNAFAPIVAGGANSISLHYGTNNCDLHDGDMLLLDLGAEYGYYNGDISRTFPVNGRFTEEQRYFYETVLQAQAEVIDSIKPGMHITETTNIARKSMFANAHRKGFAADEKDMAGLLPHGVSHYLGLDTHDSGESAILEPGMVITVEPGIYIHDLGFGIRIEDDVMITENGCEVLSPQIIKSVNDIENYLV